MCSSFTHHIFLIQATFLQKCMFVSCFYSFLPALQVFIYESLTLVPSQPQIVSKFAAVSDFDVSPNAAEFLES